ncbi:hypothetical protein COU60_00490 [Candidatus Pacearchaeota archaeon CG10_big_fil_rev_8_21_14_0_10_34_76]|nr:MAG: hypothetical protein COU60_00490 [Candidatus Pacearchaeota archaeon CG10_big_fil_rev_8_21_14_0_10_34_76]
MQAVELKQALEELRKEKKRKFSQTVELIVNLRSVDLRKDNIAILASIPNKVKDKKVCGFFEKKNPLISTITKAEFQKYSEKNALRKIVDEFDFFIANAKLMPSVASTFGKALGPAGKMPSPQLGIIPEERDDLIKPLLERISKSVKMRAKEASIKVPIGNESMKDEEIIANIKAVHAAVISSLPKKEENVKNTLIKFTMSKPIAVEVK